MFCYFTPVTGCITIFYIFTAFCYVTLLNLKNDPGGDLIREDLIRFPGSIPGAIY